MLGILLLLELDWLDLLDEPLLLLLPLVPLLELDELVARSLLELEGSALEDVAGLACWCWGGGTNSAGGMGERLLGGESPT